MRDVLKEAIVIISELSTDIVEIINFKEICIVSDVDGILDVSVIDTINSKLRDIVYTKCVECDSDVVSLHKNLAYVALDNSIWLRTLESDVLPLLIKLNMLKGC